MSGERLVEVTGLRRDYGARCAVRDLDFHVDRGEVLGLLGPNGAGKSTTLQVVSGCLAPSAGRVTLAGHDVNDSPRRAKAALGYLPEQPPLYRGLTVDEYLDFCARLHGLRGARLRAARERAKARCGLIADGRRLIAQLSKGYQQRVGIAQAILHDPPVVILDEPTVGLDPNQIREIRALVDDLGDDHAVILSTHILPEVEAVCDRVLILHRGRAVYSDRVTAAGDGGGGAELECAFSTPPDAAVLAALDGVEAVEPLGEGRFVLRHGGGHGLAEALAAASVEGGWGLMELRPRRRSLEQLFVELTCREELA
ncbi:MAG: ATP-binding cassette domain-containing protein [Gammaproteobacteria bacterium]|nr:ATP-binding cassette domain-containing protein [Gammaproteobacteria bacterium]